MATFFAIGIIINLIIGAALFAWAIKQRKLRAAQTTPASHDGAKAARTAPVVHGE